MGWAIGGSNPDGGEIFRTCPDRPRGPPSLQYNGYWVFPEGKERPRRDADPSSSSSAVVKKGKSYTSTPPMGRTACTEPQCLYKGALNFSPVNLDLLSCIFHSSFLTNILCALLFSSIRVTCPRPPHRLYYTQLCYISWYFSTRNPAGVTLINGHTWNNTGV
jgi:hypothetical protein